MLSADEARQLDRFFFKLLVGVPGLDDLARIMALTTTEREVTVTARFGADKVREMFALVRQVKIADDVMKFALRLLRATHPDCEEAPEAVRKYVRYGASPRGAQAIVLASKARALLAGRYNASIDDVRYVAPPALSHRLILNFQGEMERVPVRAIVDEALAAVART